MKFKIKQPGKIKQSGISLVEVMVSLVISLFLLGGIIQVYLGNKTTFSFTNALAEIQENGRFALDTMSQDLRLVGDWGCVNFDPDDPSNINDTLSAGTVPGYSAQLHDFANGEAIQGTDNTGLNGSDTLTLRGGKPGQRNVESPFHPQTSNLIVTGAVNTVGTGDFVLLARCGANDLLIPFDGGVFRVTASTAITGNTQRQLTLSSNKSQQFENDAIVIELQTVTYSIANSASTGEPTLIRTEFGNIEELVEGVENLQVLYGIDSDNDQFPNQYVTSNNVGVDFHDVVSLRIMLLLRSIDDFVGEAPQTYTFNGAPVTPGDRRLRQVFSTTIALRNRIGS